jgi:hypothetical protein
VVKRYPRYSETFIVTEILAHEEAGLEIEIYSLYPPVDSHFQDLLARVRAPVTYLPPAEGRFSRFWDMLREAAHDAPAIWAELASASGEEARTVFFAALVAGEARRKGIRHLHSHFATEATSVARLAARLGGISYSFTATAVEVEGRLIGGILQAREIELKRRENVALEGDVSSVAGSNFTLAPFGVTFTAPAGQVPSVGQHVDVGGEVTPPGTSLSSVTVTRVTVLPASANRRLQGPVSAHGSGADGTTDTITILGVTVDTTGLQDRDDPVLGLSSEFADAANFRITKTKFFSLLRDNISVVRAKAARNAVTGAEPFTPGPPAAFTPSSGVELEEHR